MSDTIALNDLSDAGRVVRRATRVEHAVPITVMGNDTWRGPYREQVTTINISPHGCKYESKHPVMNGYLVILELNHPDSGQQPLLLRGRVKWVKRPQATADPFQTAIEFEEPGNIWGLADPPEDWHPYHEPGLAEKHSAHQSLAIMSAEAVESVQPPSATETGEIDPRASHVPAIEVRTHEIHWKTDTGVKPALSTIAPAMAARISSLSAAGASPHSMVELVADLQQHVEEMVSAVAQSVIRQTALQIAGNLRAELHRDAKHIFSELAMAHATETLGQLNDANQESAKVLHRHWHEKIDADLKRATERISPILETARKASDDLRATREHLQAMFRDSVKNAEALENNCAARLEEAAHQIEEQFQETIDARLIWASEELERVVQSALASALSSLRDSSQEVAGDLGEQIRERVREATKNVVSESSDAITRNAKQVEQQFSEEVKRSSRAHLEFVSSALNELAKGISKIADT